MNVNLNTFAKELCENEGLKQQVNVAQMKEVLAVLGRALRERDAAEAVALVSAIISKAGRQ